MADSLFQQVAKEMGTDDIDDQWLEVHAQKLEALPVYAAFGWGWTELMAMDPEFRRRIRERAIAAYESKPFGCELCEEKPATKYHIYIGRVCADCHAALPKE